MERINITRSYLETLSSEDLNNLADDYGIDMPEDLNRRFVISELLEAAAEYDKPPIPDLQESEKKANKAQQTELPASYNENKVYAVLCNPVWCYVCWDIKNSDFHKIAKMPSFDGFVLHVFCFTDTSDKKPADEFDISVANKDREQYVLLSFCASAIRIALRAKIKNHTDMQLACSDLILLPRRHGSIDADSIYQDFDPVFVLSGLPDLLRLHYNEHRQSLLFGV